MRLMRRAGRLPRWLARWWLAGADYGLVVECRGVAVAGSPASAAEVKANVFDMLAALADEAGEAGRTLLPRL